MAPHINNLAVKASKVLNFIKRNLSNCSETKASEYLSLVRPIMEYASCVWDPHEAVNIQALKKVQPAARWAFSDYGRHSGVTRMLTQLGWPTLQHHHFVTRLTFFYKIIHAWSCSPDTQILFHTNSVSYKTTSWHAFYYSY